MMYQNGNKLVMLGALGLFLISLIAQALPLKEQKQGQPSTPSIISVLPSKVRFKRGESGQVKIVVNNPLRSEFNGRLLVKMIKGLDDSKTIYDSKIKVKSGEKPTFNVPINNDQKEFGHEIQATLFDAKDKQLSQKSEYYSVADDIFKVYVASFGYKQIPAPFCHIPYSWNPEMNQAWKERNPYNYGNYKERFAWAPGEWFDLTPDTEFWWSGQSCYRSSEKSMQGMIKSHHDRGAAVACYINQGASGSAGYEVYRQHPEWFGAPTQFDAKTLSIWEKKSFATPDMHSWYAVFADWSNEDARQYVTNEIIASKKRYGWDAFRWDCGQFHGKTDELSAAYMKELKEKVWKIFPDTGFGYNWGPGTVGIKEDADPREYLKNPNPYFVELCRGGGLIMAEEMYTAYSKSSPLHKWEHYIDYIVRMQEIINRLGGYYNTFPQRRQGPKYEIDKRYEAIFNLAARAHLVGLYDYHAFITRYSEVLWDPRLYKLYDPEKVISVTGSSELWWKPFVAFREKKNQNLRYVIPLITPPYAEGIEDDPKQNVRPPVKDVKLSISVPEGKKLASAWILNADKDKDWGQKLKTEAGLNGKINLIIPDPIRFWQVVVVDFTNK